ncbi:YqhR family membrane protein [Cohnella mopanensis]|uniref:YqhR family membrane protein n=1 Tax=Cohnella mopanensis TaxID=2911966 RepID=UPI001EF76B4B|nr:YqhR family membrane protein [Cohnella mopanensis]
MASKETANAESDKNNSPPPTKSLVFSVKIGFFAGLIWGVVRWLATGLNFTNVTQAFLLDPFVPRKMLGGFYWQAAGLGMFILMSMLAGLVYLAVFGRLRGPWPGIFFGAAWWGLFYAWLGPLIGAMPPLRQIGWNSIVTDFCLFLVWGVFIGFSIAFELHNEAAREPSNSPSRGSPQTSS